MKDPNNRWFVVVWKGEKPVEVYSWESWLSIDIQLRHLDNCMVSAKDELDAFQKAQSKPREAWIEWMEEADDIVF